MEYLVVEDLFTKGQHEFVRRKSYATNLLETLDIVTKSLAEGFEVNVVYLDF